MDARPLCAAPGADPAIWFSGPENTALAKSICARCLSRDRCLSKALDLHPVEGVWGGTTIGERAALLAEQARRDRLPLRVRARAAS